MVRRRRPVPTLQDALAVSPQAAPAPGQADTIAPLDLPIYDFAPISEALQGHLQAEARKDAERKIQAGERWAVENPALVDDIERDMASIKDAKLRAEKTKEAFALLQRTGQIVAPADPFWQVGYARAAGRQLASQYRTSLQARMAEVSTVREGGDVTAAPDLERIIAEEWEKIGNSPSVQNFYGGQEALAAKAAADEEFRTKAGLMRAQAQERDYQDLLTREIGGRFDQLLAQNPVVTSETLQPITDYLTEEVRGHNVMNPRELTMDALELSIQRLAAVDADEAVRAVHAAQDLVVGDVRLGDDRGAVGLRLQELTQRVREQARSSAMQEVQLTEARRKSAIQKGESEYIGLLLQARRDGQSVTEIARRLETEYIRDDAESGRFDGQAPFVVNAMQEYARQLDSTRTSDGAVIDQFNVLLADGDLESADALIRASLATGGVTGEDYGRALATLSQRRDVSPYVEESGLYQATKARYAQAKPTGFDPATQARLDDDVLDRQRRLERDFVTYVRTTEGKPNREDLHRTWLSEREAADLAEIRKVEGETRAKGDETVRAVRERMARFQDARDMIDRAEKEGTLPVLEAQALREEAAKAVQGRERFFNSEAYQAAEQEIDRQFVALAGGATPDATLLTTQRIAHQEFRDRFEIALDALLADPSASPATFDARARSEARRIATEVSDQLFPAGRRAIEKAVKTGASAEEALNAEAQLSANHQAAVDLAALFSDPSQREKFTGGLLPQDPAVPPEFYETAARWMSGLDPVFGRPFTRGDVDHAFERTATAIVRDPTLPESARQEAIGNMLSTIGIDPLDVMRGKVEIRPSFAEVEEAKKQIAFLRLTDRDLRGERDKQIAELEAFVGSAPVEVDLSSYQWPAYTTPFFRSTKSLDAFQRDPAYPEFLVRLGLDPEDDDQVEAWLIAQTAAISRVNP